MDLAESPQKHQPGLLLKSVSMASSFDTFGRNRGLWPLDLATTMNPSTTTKRLETAQIDPNAKTDMLGLDMSDFGIRTLPRSLFAFDFVTDLRLANNCLR